MVEMQELKMGYLSLIDLGGDPYKKENILRAINMDSGIFSYYNIEVDFTEEPHDLMVCPLCKEETVADNEYGDLSCASCKNILKLAIT